MGDNGPLDRAIAAENSPIGCGKKVVDSMATEWTDEKHRSYLNSIEASFVKQLCSSEYGSNDLLGLLSRAKIHANPSASESKNQSFGQFKVHRRGCWEKLKFERAENQAGNEDESLKLCESPWIQHFWSQSIDKERHLKSTHQMDNNKSVDQLVHLTNQRYANEATSSKLTPSFCSQKVHRVSIGSITEVSDQNFVDAKDDGGEEMNRRAGRKRPRSAVSSITDQVVPFATPKLDERTTPVKHDNEECSKRKFENKGGSFLHDPNPNDPKNGGG